MQREVDVFQTYKNTPINWVGQYREIYHVEDWEPVPETRWVPCETWVLDDGERINVAWMTHFIEMAKGYRATIIALGTVRFEQTVE